jgi:hypothetical protein
MAGIYELHKRETLDFPVLLQNIQIYDPFLVKVLDFLRKDPITDFTNPTESAMI